MRKLTFRQNVCIVISCPYDIISCMECDEQSVWVEDEYILSFSNLSRSIIREIKRINSELQESDDFKDLWKETFRENKVIVKEGYCTECYTKCYYIYPYDSRYVKEVFDSEEN